MCNKVVLGDLDTYPNSFDTYVVKKGSTYFTCKAYYGLFRRHWISGMHPDKEFGVKIEDGDQWWTVEEFESIINAGLGALPVNF